MPDEGVKGYKVKKYRLVTTPESTQMTDLRMASLIRSSLLGKVSFDTLVRDTKSLGYFLTHFGSLTTAQRDYEAREVEGTQNQLVYSKLMQSYLEIAHMFGLDKVVTAAAHSKYLHNILVNLYFKHL